MGTDHRQPLWRLAATHTLHTSFLLKARLEDALVAETGLLLADHEALINLVETPMRMSDIASRLVLSRGGATKLIDRLEALGHVQRGPDEQDRRATLVTITESGEAASQRTRAIVDAELEVTWRNHVSDAEAKLIVEIMRRVLDEHDQD